MTAWFVLGLLVAAPSAGAGHAPTVTVDFSAVDREALSDSALSTAYKNLLLRLAEDGFSVVEPSQGGDIAVRVGRTSEQHLNIVVETSLGAQSRKVRFGEDAGEQEQFQLIYTTLDLVRKAHDELSARPPSLPLPAADSRATGAQLGSAILWSGTSAGLMANVDGEIRLGSLHLTLGLVVHQPLGLPSELHIFEWGALAGLRAGTRALAPWLVLEAALGAGFLQERYRYSDPGVGQDGVLEDGLATGSLGAALEITRGLRFGFTGGTWLTLHQRSHATANGTPWKGPRIRPFVGARVEYLP
jgi:hypothetical protein